MAVSPLLRRWTTLAALPAGALLFSAVLGFVAPYASSIRPRVRRLEPGLAEVELRDRWGVRNHLKSIHAVALANLGELTANLALMGVQPPDGRFIVTAMHAEYLKKARGTIVAACELEPGRWDEPHQRSGEALLRDRSGDLVCRVRLDWKVGPAARG